MGIVVRQRSYGVGTGEIVSVSRAIEVACDGDDYDRGSLEAARATANNTARVLGKLVEKLTVAGLLTVDDLNQMFDYRCKAEEE